MTLIKFLCELFLKWYFKLYSGFHIDLLTNAIFRNLGVFYSTLLVWQVNLFCSCYSTLHKCFSDLYSCRLVLLAYEGSDNKQSPFPDPWTLISHHMASFCFLTRSLLPSLSLFWMILSIPSHLSLRNPLKAAVSSAYMRRSAAFQALFCSEWAGCFR